MKQPAPSLTEYRKLNDAQRALFDGGCGPKGWPEANWFFKASCQEHDYNYAVGGTEADRRWYDWGFYTAMRKDIKRLSWWQQPFAAAQAALFYRLVRWFGSKRFHYGTKRSFQEVVA